MSVGSNSDTGSSHAQDATCPSPGIEGQGINPDEGNPWFPLCASRLSVLNNPKIPLTEVKAKFEQELRWIEETKSVIKSRLNMLRPIARLSPEVLAHVFRLLADSDSPIIHIWDSAVNFGWIRVTHVCRSWRNVALDYPDLWGRVNICSPPGWTDERLRRSKEAPFDVMIHSREPIPPAVVANVHRVREVSFDRGVFRYPDGEGDMDMDMDASHRALLTSSAPFLLSFSYRHTYWSPGKYLKLPYNIFACNAPRLTYLHLENTTLTFHPSIFENLVHLCLNYGHVTIDGTFDINIPLNRNQLLELLLQVPKLETLMLGGKIDKSLEDTESQSDVNDHQLGPVLYAAVPLPQLKQLALGGDPWSWLWLAEQLSIPATASFWLQCQMVSAVQDQAPVCDAFLPFMIRHLMEKSYLQFTQLLRVMCRSRGWRLTMLAGWIDNLHNADPPIWPPWKFLETMPQTVSAPIDFEFSSVVGPVIPMVQVLRPLLAKIHMNNIRHLKVCGTASHLDCIEWLKLFASFTLLEHLSIDGMVTFNLMQALGLDLSLNLWPSSVLGHTSLPGKQVLFPNLFTLELSNVDFTRFVDAADALLSEITTAALTERHEMNRTLKDIRLLDCRFHGRWVDGLRNVGFRCTCNSFLDEASRRHYPLYDDESIDM